jgi:hypothetical protein
MSKKTPTDDELRIAAVRLYYDAGAIEIEPDAAVSTPNDHDAGIGERGAYVQAWVWVAYEAVIDEDRKNACPVRCDCKTCRPELYVGGAT